MSLAEAVAGPVYSVAGGVNVFRAFTSFLLAAIAARALAGQPMRLGALARGDLVDDIPSMVSAAAPEGTVSAIDLRGSQILPFSWHADVFLTPSASTEGVRHGRVLHLKCSPAEGSDHCTSWEPEEPPSAYVQVESDPGPRKARRPIRVYGELADAELRALVAFVRTSPHPASPPSAFTMGIDGHHPITDIRVDDDGSVRVWVTTGQYTGQRGEFQRTRDGWILLRAVHGIA